MAGGRNGSPTPGEILPVLNGAGPNWPPIFINRLDLKFKGYVLASCLAVRLTVIFAASG